MVSIETKIISFQINKTFDYRVLTDNFLKDLLIKNKVGRKVDCHFGLEELQIYIHRHPMVSYALNKTLCTPDRKMYDLVRAARGFFNLLKVDMFMNPTDIKLAQAATNKSLLYTPEGEVSAEFHGHTQMNPYFILLNVGYPMDYYWKKPRDAFRFDYVFMSLRIYFRNVLSLSTCLLQTVSTLF